MLQAIQVFFSRASCLCVLLTLSVTTTAAVNPTPFADDVNGRLFRVQGSNTVGANLMKNLLVNYFTHRGLTDIRVEPAAVENEYRVSGRSGGRSIYVDVAAHGSSTGFKALLANDADLSMSSRPIKDKEVNQMKHFGDMLGFDAEHVIAIDGLAVIVHPNNPVQQLSLDQLAAVFSGQVQNWRQVGGEDRPIALYARDDKSGTWDTFKSLVLRNQVSLPERASRFESNDQLSDRVSQDRGGIGFVGLASVRNSRALLVADEGTQPLSPGKVTVATEDYVLSRRLFLYTPPSLKTEQINEFVAFVQTDAGQQQVEETGFISQALTAIRPQDNRQGPPDYLNVTQAASRLSVNFRFAEGSSSLDNKARQDIRRVVDYMQRQEHQAKSLTLVGFGDEKQSDSRSLVLSKLRAVAVKTELHKLGVASEPVQGFGAYLPVASNDGDSKIKNRRVEVWVQ